MLQYWIFPRPGRLLLTVDEETSRRISRGDLVFWAEESGEIEICGKVGYQQRTGPAGPQTPKVRAYPERLPSPIDISDLPPALRKRFTDARDAPGRLLALDREAGDDLSRRASQAPRSIPAIVWEFTTRQTAALGQRSVELGKSVWQATSQKTAQLGRSVVDLVSRSDAGQRQQAEDGRDEAADKRTPNGGREPAKRKEAATPTCWIVQRPASGIREEQLVHKGVFDQLEAGARVLWLAPDGGIDSWGLALGREGWGTRRARRSATAYRRPLTVPIPAGEIRRALEGDEIPDRPYLVPPAAAKELHQLTRTTPVSFQEAFREELEVVYSLRELRGYPRRRNPEGVVFHQAHRSQLTGLALSGGGIRSATFNLGILQGLAQKGLLAGIDYLSTVSGGGYIGSWLVAWIKRFNLEQVQERLRSEQPPVRRGDPLSAAERWSPITFLRRYSNYLAPRPGLFSADSWTIFATYARNLLLNLLILATSLAALLLVPRLAVLLSEFFHDGRGFFSHSTMMWIALAGLSTGVSFLFVNIMELSDFTSRTRSRDATATETETATATETDGEDDEPAGNRKVQLTVVAPFFLAAWAASCWIWLSAQSKNWAPLEALLTSLSDSLAGLVGDLAELLGGSSAQAIAKASSGYDWVLWMAIAAVLYPLLWSLVSIRYWFRSRRQWNKERFSQTVLLVVAATAAGAGGGALLWWFASILVRQTSGGFALMVLWGPPLLVLDIVLTAVLHIGLMGRDFPEDHRQWWSRLGAWMVIACLAWLSLFSLALYGPVLVEWLVGKGKEWVGGVSVGWLLSSLGGIWAAHSGKTAKARNGKQLELLVQVTPYLFVAGLLALLAYASQKAIAALLESQTSAGSSFQQLLGDHLAATWEHSGGLFLVYLILALALIGGLSGWLSSRIDLNEFSMHLFYRNRLIRAYLGASRVERDPHPFTGFDAGDDLELHTVIPPGFVCAPELSTGPEQPEASPYDGPYPILNTTLNLTAGGELAWQERLAAPYSYSPLFYGFHTGVEATDENLAGAAAPDCEPFAFRCSGLANEGDGVSLGTALTVSGAAVSPNMGYHSSPALAFLLTVFNARLGLWQGNPKRKDTWSKPGPNMGLYYLLAELFGYTNADSQYVNLSDGGFFDNLGIYELVRRRCRFIVACDAEADPKLEFAGLGNAIRKCRADLGVEIDIHVDPIRKREGQDLSDWHCAVGTIRYPDERSPRGTLVYIKASLTGDEPEDVLDYAAVNPGFPHQSTGDQFFDESQFESYRRLGLHAAESVFGPADLRQARAPAKGAGNESSYVRMEPVFVDLRQAWYPKSKAAQESFTTHAGLLDQIFERLRTQRSLAFLVPQVYMELKDWRRGRPVLAGSARQPAEWHPLAPEELTTREFQDGFFLCNSVIQLMENVYLDLDLESQWRHPDNRGWKNLFRQWSWSWMFRLTWAVSASTYGARFQKFCERQIGLDPGTVWTSPVARKTARWAERLTEFERHLIIRAHRECDLLPSRTQVLALRVMVLEPRAAFQRKQRQRRQALVDEPRTTDRRFEFTFGFAIVRTATTPTGDPEPPGLVFLRVRDHLRSLGLGRRALEHLILYQNVVWPDDPPRDEDLRRVSPELDILRLSDMFKSARNEMEPLLER